MTQEPANLCACKTNGDFFEELAIKGFSAIHPDRAEELEISRSEMRAEVFMLRARLEVAQAEIARFEKHSTSETTEISVALNAMAGSLREWQQMFGRFLAEVANSNEKQSVELHRVYTNLDAQLSLYL